MGILRNRLVLVVGKRMVRCLEFYAAAWDDYLLKTVSLRT